MIKSSPAAQRPEPAAAAADRQRLRVALAEATQALDGNGGEAGHDALRELADAVAAFLEEKPPGAEIATVRPQADLASIETGSSCSLPGVGRRVCAAVRGAVDGDLTTMLSIGGRPAAVIVPVDSQGHPACTRVDHARALAQTGQLPAFPSRAEAAAYAFSDSVGITCGIDGDRVSAGAADLAAALAAAGEHEYRHQRQA